MRCVTEVLSDLINGQLDQMAGRLEETARLAEGLNLFGGVCGQAGQAIYVFVSQMEIVYDEHFVNPLGGGRIEKLMSHLADVVPHLAIAVGENEAVVYKKAVEVSAILLRHLGRRSETRELGPEIDSSVRSQIGLAVGRV